MKEVLVIGVFILAGRCIRSGSKQKLQICRGKVGNYERSFSVGAVLEE